MKKEIWKDIPNYPSYKVSNLGRIKSLKRNKELILTGGFDKNGYKIHSLYDHDNIRKTQKEHRLIAKVFVPNPNNFPQINHKNGIKSDNRIENLEWCNQSQNLIHSYKNLPRKEYRGSKNHMAKLTDNQVLEIRKLQKSYTQDKLAKIYNVAQVTIWRIINRKRYANVA